MRALQALDTFPEESVTGASLVELGDGSIASRRPPPAVPDLDDPRLKWKPLRRVIPSIPSPWLHWIKDGGSLTERLQRKSAGDFRVEVVEEGWRRVFAANLVSRLGREALGRTMWSRKVILWGCGEPWVTAHTLVPYSSLQTPLKQVKTLQTKPLGAFLFAHPALTRSRLDIVRLDPGWGRRSLFFLYNRPVLVAEYFLPALVLDSGKVGRNGYTP